MCVSSILRSPEEGAVVGEDVSLALQNDSNRMEPPARTKNSKLIERKGDEVIR